MLNAAERHAFCVVLSSHLQESEVRASRFENGQVRRSDTIFLIVVGLVALGASAGMFYLGKIQDQPLAAKPDDEDRPRFPLPCGTTKISLSSSLTAFTA